MKTLSIFAVSLLLITLTSPTADGQPLSLRGSSSLELNLGLWSESRASAQISQSGVQSSAKTNGFIGGLTYSYWMRENVAITVAGSLLSAEATMNVVNAAAGYSSIATALTSPLQSANSIASFIVGMRYYLPEPEQEDHVRPFVSVGVGSYMGFEASNSLLSVSAHSESAFGGRVGAGLDVFLGSVVKFNANAGYNVMTDFQNAVGARRNFNGIDASLGIGFIF